ncbi:hypothetical protein [Acidithiobacillus sp.]|uniref:hypothetical protein n=1 Tax=Acidithiobacillus sp. TaxID=1872118 RepID=UPI003D090653
MKHLVKLMLTLAIFAVAGCASHHHSGQISARQASENLTTGALSGGPMTSKSKSLADYTP